MGELRPVHRSVPPGGLLPRGMTRTRLTEEQAYFLDRFALSIFTDCVNAGRTFQEAITAVYLSGMENGIAAINGAAHEH